MAGRAGGGRLPDQEPSTSAFPRPVVAVFGLARGCGATVVARALAAELARRDVHGTAAVHCEAGTSGIPLATQAAGRLARLLGEVHGADTRAVGRLCLVGGAGSDALAAATREVVPLVLDAGAGVLGGVPAALADRVVLVAAPRIEPALADVAAACLARVGHEPIVVVNRVARQDRDGGDETHGSEPLRETGWATRAVHPLPEARMGAQLALSGREPRGELGAVIAELADRCEAGT